jgi:hypothetical protein
MEPPMRVMLLHKLADDIPEDYVPSRVTRCWGLLSLMLEFAVLYSLICQILPLVACYTTADGARFARVLSSAANILRHKIERGTSGLSERLVQRSCEAPRGIGIGPPERLAVLLYCLMYRISDPLAAL